MRGGIAQIHDHQAEAAALDQQVGRFEGVFGAVPAAHPKQARQVHAGIGGGVWGKGVLGIHERASFLARGGGGQQREQQAGAAGGGGPDDFGETSAGQPAGGRIDFRNAGGGAFGLGAGLPVEGCAEDRFELFQEDSGTHLFAFYSPALYFYRRRTRKSRT